VLSSLFAKAQSKANDTTIKATTIEITQIYQPQIKQAVKETYTPTLPPREAALARFDYNIPSQTVNYAYKPMPLQPLAMGSDTTSKGFKNYVKAGLGNLRTIFLDAGFNQLAAKNVETFVHFGLLSQKGALPYQKQTLASLNAMAIYQQPKYNLLFDIAAHHHNFYQYGYDQAALPNKIAGKQTLSGGSVTTRFFDKGFDNNGFRKVANVGLSYYTGSIISSQAAVFGQVGLDKKWDSSLLATIAIEANTTQLNAPFYNVNNSFASLKIGAKYNRDKVSLKAYLLPTIGQNQNTFLLNDIEFKYKLSDLKATIGMGLKGSLVQNTFQQLFEINPFISSFPSAQTHTNEIFLLSEKSLGHHLSFTGKVSWWQHENFATFINPSFVDPEKMMVLYIPKVNALSLQLGMRYQVGNNLSVGGQLAMFRFNNIVGNAKVWHTPSFRLNGDMQWNPLKDLSITAYMAYVGGNYAISPTYQTIKLKAFVDMGFGAEYIAWQKISLFLNCNNLLNNKYQRWQAYQVYGINIYGGVRLKF
jgi:hypothetical protein